MKRRKFLSYMGAAGASIMIPGVMYGNSDSNVESGRDKRIKERNTSLEILSNKNNFNYNGNIKTEDWADKIKHHDIEYIIKNSKNVLNSSYNVSTGKRVLNISLENFKKILTSNPHFIVPLATKILKDSGYDVDEVASAAILKRGDLEHGLWYVEKGSVGREINGKMAIPYADDNKMLIYGEGEKWNVKGKFVSLVNYKEVDGKVNIDTSFFVNSKGRGFGWLLAKFAPNTIANKVKENGMELIEVPGKLMHLLESGRVNTKKHGKKESTYLEDLLK